MSEGLQPVHGLQHHERRDLLHIAQDARAEPERDWALPQPELCNLPQGLCPVHGVQHDSGRAVLQWYVQQVLHQHVRAKRGLLGTSLLQVRSYSTSQSDDDVLGRSSLYGNPLLQLLLQLV